MSQHAYIERVVDLTRIEKNVIFNMSNEQAIELLRDGTPADVDRIDGQFALVSVEGKTIKLARSLARPMRSFIAKMALILAIPWRSGPFAWSKRRTVRYGSCDRISRSSRWSTRLERIRSGISTMPIW